MTDTARPASGLVVPAFRPDPEGTHPPLDYPDYNSTALRHPSRPLVPLAHMLTETTAPVFGDRPRDARPTPTSRASTTASRWASGSSSRAGCSRTTGARCPTRWSRSGRPTRPAATATRSTSTPRRWTPTSRAAGAASPTPTGRFRFVTIKPGAYPWGNHHNAWRPAHIHFSVFGRAFVQRLVTQMYFPGDPLFFQDPIFNSVPDPAARERMICRFDLDADQARVGAGLPASTSSCAGRDATPMEHD